MTALVLMLATLQAAPDTVRLSASEAFDRGLEHSSVLAAFRFSAEAASNRAEQAGAWRNPSLGVSAEDVGQQMAFTGIPGSRGLEGQAVLTAPLPVGWERSGRIRSARAGASAAAAESRAAELGVQRDLLGAMGVLLRETARLETAQEELSTLDRIADALARQAEAGRASRGDAARAELARGMAGTTMARREAAFAAASADVARLVGLPATSFVRIDPSICTMASVTPSGGADPTAPELLIAEARVDAARGDVEMARGIQLPDLTPQVGVRRSGGNTGLYLGLSTHLPLFDLGTERMSAALASERAAMSLRVDTEARLSAAHATAVATLDAMNRGGTHFDDGWFESVDQTVTAAEARFDLGEGTLFELLDSRRARTLALDDYHQWLTEWWNARTEVARLQGRSLTSDLLCSDPFRETR